MITHADALALTRNLQHKIDARGKIDRSINADLTQLQSWLLSLPELKPEPSGYVCPRCGIDKKGPQGLADHLANVHDENKAAVTA